MTAIASKDTPSRRLSDSSSSLTVRGDWKCENGKRGTAKNAAVENARLENAAPYKGGKRGTNV